MRQRAFTLLEMIVVTALAFLLLSLTVQFVLPAMRLSLRTQYRTQMQQACYITLSKIRTDLEQTNASAIGFINKGGVETDTIVAIQPLLDEVPNSRPAYLQELIVYEWKGSQDKLMRKVWRPAPDVTPMMTDDPTPKVIPSPLFKVDGPTRLTLAQLHSVLTLPQSAAPYESRQICPDVTEFSISSATSSPNIENPIRLKLSLKRQEDTCTLEQTVYLRNSP